jgi:hypothetical protein
MALTWMAPFTIRHRRKVLTTFMVVATTAVGACAGAALAVGRAVLAGRHGAGDLPGGTGATPWPDVASVTSLVALNAAVFLGLVLIAGHAGAVLRHRQIRVGAGVPRDEAVADGVRVAAPVLVRRAATAAAVLAALLLVPSTGVRALAWAGLATVALALLVAGVVLPALLSAAGDRADRYQFAPVTARQIAAGDPGRVGVAPWLLPAAAALVILAVTAGAPVAPSWAAAAPVHPATAPATTTPPVGPAADATVVALTTLAAVALLATVGLFVILAWAADALVDRRHRSGRRGAAPISGPLARGPADGAPPRPPALPAAEDPPGLATCDGAPASRRHGP